MQLLMYSRQNLSLNSWIIKMIAKITFTLSVLIISVSLHASETRWYQPDHIKSQIAGNIGTFSIGVGKSFDNDNFSFDFWYGYVPEQIGGIDIKTIAVKTRYQILDERNMSTYSLKPLYFGVMLSHVFGKQYLSGRYDLDDPDYYFWTNVHLMPHVGIEIDRKLRSRQKAGLYIELGALDTYLIAYRFNRDVINVTEIFNLSIGANFEF